MANARVHVRLGDVLVRHPCALQHVDHLTHVAARQSDQRPLAVLAGLQTLCVDDIVQARYDLLLDQRRKPEARAARLHCRNDLAQVVADDAEAHVVGVLLDDCGPGWILFAVS